MEKVFQLSWNHSLQASNHVAAAYFSSLLSVTGQQIDTNDLLYLFLIVLCRKCSSKSQLFYLINLFSVLLLKIIVKSNLLMIMINIFLVQTQHHKVGEFFTNWFQLFFKSLKIICFFCRLFWIKLFFANETF